MTKENTISIAGTITVHLVLFLLLLFYYVKPSDDLISDEELSGVPVMFGNVQDALGNDKANGIGNGTNQNIENVNIDKLQPNNIENNETPKEELKPEIVQKPIVKPTEQSKDQTQTQTQNIEKTVSLEDTKKDQEKKREKEALIKEQQLKAEAAAKAKQVEEKKKNINNQLAGLFGDGTGTGSRGNTSGSGTQGSPSGNGDIGKTSGVGGRGSYDLGGRGVGAAGLVLPAYDVDDYGTVVVDIIVDPQGNVIETGIGRGTTTSNATLRSESIRAARKTKFKIINTSNNQRGTITYKFNLN